MERKAGENTEKYSIFDFENTLISRISGGRNDQVAVKFRELHLRPLGQLTVCISILFSLPKNHSKIFWEEKQERKHKSIRFEILKTRN